MLVRSVFLLFISVVLLLGTDETVATAGQATTVVIEEQKAFYTPDEVSQAGVLLQKELLEINISLTPTDEIANMEASLPAYVNELRTIRTKIETTKLPSYSIKRLTHLTEQTRFYKEELQKLALALQTRVDIHTEALKRLKALETVWVVTLQYAVNENAPEAIVSRIKQHLSDIALMYNGVKHSYDNVLTFSDMAITEDQELKILISDLEKTKNTLEIRLFVKDSEPLIRAIDTYTFDLPSFISAAFETLNDIHQNVIIFYETNSDSFYIHLFFTTLVMALLFYLFVQERRGTLFVLSDKKVRGSMFFVRSPFAATIILSVLMVAAIYPERPVAVSYANVLLALAALLVIIYKIANKTLFRYALLLSILFTVGGLINQIIAFEVEIRILWFGITAIMLFALSQTLRSKGLLSTFKAGTRLRFLNRAGIGVLMVLGISLIANLTGFYLLALKLAHATLISLTLFMAFMIISVVINGLIVMFVRRRSLHSKHLLESYANQIEGNLKFIVSTFLLVYWIYLVLKQFEITYFVKEHFDAAMAMSWQIGDVTLSVGSLVDFFIVLAVTSFMTRFVRIILDLEVFSRYELPRGMPTAIQMMIRYLIITVGLLFSLSVLGIQMSDLSLLAGALGVGIGFGLRNIMANFVSGVLMIFERPVQLGDVVEVDNIFGDVQRIGIRATTIKTYDGSEVIVPNADFITKEVTNWTLSSKLRRVKMAYKVAFGNNPREVIKIMHAVVDTHPGIMTDPAPKVLFEGYGDYYLEFTVYFWVEERLLDIKSETAIAVYEALSKAGIEMPIPISNVRYESHSPQLS